VNNWFFIVSLISQPVPVVQHHISAHHFGSKAECEVARKNYLESLPASQSGVESVCVTQNVVTKSKTKTAADLWRGNSGD